MDNKIDPMKPERTKEEILKDALNNWVEEYAFQVPYHNKGPIANDDYYDQLKLKYGSDGFKAGAKWMEEYKSQSSPVESRDAFAMKFLEYASGLAVSNYKSGGNWYLSDGRIVKTADILKQFKSELPIEETKEK